MAQSNPSRLLRRVAFAALCALLLLAMFQIRAQAKNQPDEGDGDRTSVLRSIVVEPGDSPEDVTCFFCPVHVKGTVNGDVVTFWAGVDVEGTVRGDVVVIGGAIDVRSRGKIEGDSVALPGQVVEEPRSSFGGETDEHPWCHLPGQRQIFWRGAVGWLAHLMVFSFLILLFIGARRVYQQAEYISLHPARTVLTGLIVFAVILGLYAVSPYLLTGRFGKYIGDWAIGVTVLWGLLLVAGLAGTCTWLARAFFSTMNVLVLTLAGAVLVALISLIPFAGFVLFLLLMFAAMGVPIWTRFRAEA